MEQIACTLIHFVYFCPFVWDAIFDVEFQGLCGCLLHLSRRSVSEIYPVFPAVYVGGNPYKLKVKLVSALYGVQESTNNVLEKGKEDQGLRSLLDEKKVFLFLPVSRILSFNCGRYKVRLSTRIDRKGQES